MKPWIKYKSLKTPVLGIQRDTNATKECTTRGPLYVQTNWLWIVIVNIPTAWGYAFVDLHLGHVPFHLSQPQCR